MKRAGKLSVTLGQLTSLDLIRGFVAVGRRMSITRAAEDLCLTQSAVSRQVRTLEEMLGVKLLLRGHRAVSFTKEGEQLFRHADQCLKQLQDVIGAIRAGSAARPVTLTSSVSVAGLWLLPRLGAFLLRHPTIDLRIAADNRLSDLRADELDLAIRYCPAEAAPAGAVRLFGETVVPVAHPSLGLSAIRSPEQLESQVLLEFDGEYRPWLRWNEWIVSQGWERFRPRSVLRFSQYDQTIQAAMASQGVALGRLGLIDSAIADGRLATVTLPQPGPVTAHSYWLIQASAAPSPEVEAVVRWIREEAQKIAV